MLFILGYSANESSAATQLRQQLGLMFTKTCKSSTAQFLLIPKINRYVAAQSLKVNNDSSTVINCTDADLYLQVQLTVLEESSIAPTIKVSAATIASKLYGRAVLTQFEASQYQSLGLRECLHPEFLSCGTPSLSLSITAPSDLVNLDSIAKLIVTALKDVLYSY